MDVIAGSPHSTEHLHLYCCWQSQKCKMHSMLLRAAAAATATSACNVASSCCWCCCCWWWWCIPKTTWQGFCTDRQFCVTKPAESYTQGISRPKVSLPVCYKWQFVQWVLYEFYCFIQLPLFLRGSGTTKVKSGHSSLPHHHCVLRLIWFSFNPQKTPISLL